MADGRDLWCHFYEKVVVIAFFLAQIQIAPYKCHLNVKTRVKQSVQYRYSQYCSGTAALVRSGTQNA